MKEWLAVFTFLAISSVGGFAAPKGPQVELIDNKLSISAEAIPLGRLLQLVDRATGMKSTVPPELANRNLSVRFSGLNLTDGVRKMFQGQPLDYIVVAGQGIVVTAASQTTGSADSAPPPFNPPQAQQFDQQFNQQFNQGFNQEFPPPGQPPFQQPFQQPQQQPAMVQTPFGPIPNPRAQQQQPNVPLNAPGQQNSLFPQASPGNGQPQALPGIPGMPGMPQGQPNNPFGTPSQFGTPNPAGNQNNPLFGSPPVFITPGNPPRQP